MASPLKGRTLPEDHSRKVAKAKTAERILAAARLMFERDGYKEATIRGIAKEAGMSTGAVFANYKDKDELYEAVYGHGPVTPEQGRRAMLALRGIEKFYRKVTRIDPHLAAAMPSVLRALNDFPEEDQVR